MTAVAEAKAANGAASPPLSVYKRMLAVIASVGHVEKDKRNEFHRYDYSSIEAVVEAVQGALIENGLLVLAGEDETTDRARQTNQGESTVTTIRLTFKIMDVETNESVSIPWVGRGDDPADKGVAKALTDARKSFLVQQFNLVRGGSDTEADAQTDQRVYGQPRQTQPKDTVNLLENARGLSNDQLNAVMAKAGLSQVQSPYGWFAKVPKEYAARLAELLKEARGG